MNKILNFLLLACFNQVALSSVKQTSTSRVISVRDYYSMLMAVPDSAGLYSDAMAADPEGCGIIRTETDTGCDYKIVAGMEDHPMQGIEQEQQEYYEHWVEQEEQQEKNQLTSPLMMLGEHGKTNSRAAETKSGKEKQREDGLRERSDVESTSSSSLKERSQNIAGIGEHQPPLTELHLGAASDEISGITDPEMSSITGYYAPAFSPINSSDRFYQAQDRLKKAREESKVAVEYFDRTLEQWNHFKAMQQAKSQHERLQQQLFLAYNEWSKSVTAFQQADVNFRTAAQNNDSSRATLYKIAAAEEQEMFQKNQAYQALLFQAQSAHQRYNFMQQMARQHEIMEGVNYETLLEEARQRAASAADQLQKFQEEVRRAKFERSNTPKNSFKDTLQKGPARSVEESVSEDAVKRTPRSTTTRYTAGEEMRAVSAVESKKTSYQDQGTQISAEDLAAWEREALLKKQDRWKARFHQIVEQLRESKRRIKEVIKATLPDQILDNVLSRDLFLGVAREALQAASAERQILEEEQRIRAAAEKNQTLHVMMGKITEAEKQRAALVSRIVRQALDGIVEKIDVADQQERAALAAAKKRARKKAAKQRKKLGKKEAEVAAKITTAAAALHEIGEKAKFLCQTKEKFYRDHVDLLGEEATEREKWEMQAAAARNLGDAREQARAEMEQFCISLVGVPSTEYKLKTVGTAGIRYGEPVAKEAHERSYSEATAKKENLSQIGRDPRESLSFFEQIPIFFKNKNFLRFIESIVSRKIVDATRESDMRARHYFQELGKKEPWVSEFWDKSAEIEVILKQEREAKQRDIMSLAASEEEGHQQFEQWLAEWPKRLEEERDQKEKARLEQERLAEEVKKQAILEKRDRERQQAEDEFLAGEKKKPKFSLKKGKKK